MKKQKQSYKIYLFRHGETFYNKNHMFTGWKDSKLTPLGIKQAKIVAKKLKSKKIPVFFKTDLTRSNQTLKEVMKFHPEVEEIITANRMIERSYGDLEGTSHESFSKRIGEQQLNLRKEGDALENLSKENQKRAERFFGEQSYKVVHRGYNTSPPNGESLAMVEKRVKKFIKNLKKFIKKERVNVGISAHSNSIRMFRKIMENATREEAKKWFIPFDKVYTFEVEV